jgi:plasmid stabilization system protein ParE
LAVSKPLVWPTWGGLVVWTGRVLVEAPYIIVYEVDEDRAELTVLAVFHGAQNLR